MNYSEDKTKEYKIVIEESSEEVHPLTLHINNTIIIISWMLLGYVLYKIIVYMKSHRNYYELVQPYMV